MSNVDSINVIGRTFEVQAIYQQALMQGELSVRQAERRLAAERERRLDEVQASEAAAETAPLKLDLFREQDDTSGRMPRPRKVLGRYRMAWVPGGAIAQLEDREVPFPQIHLDLHA